MTLTSLVLALGIQADYKGGTHLTRPSGSRTTILIASHCNPRLSLQSAESRREYLVIRSESNPDKGRSLPRVAEEDARGSSTRLYEDAHDATHLSAVRMSWGGQETQCRDEDHSDYQHYCFHLSPLLKEPPCFWTHAQFFHNLTQTASENYKLRVIQRLTID